MQIAEGFKNQVQARIVSARQQFERDSRTTLNPVTISEAAMNEFDQKWSTVELRMKIVPGKEVFSALNTYLQAKYKISLNPIFVVENFLREEISSPVAELLNKLDEIRKEDAPDQTSLEFSPATPD
jgi:hypothetical protein